MMLTQKILLDWRDAASALAEVGEQYRVAHANAFIAADGSDTKRKAAADVATTEQRKLRDIAEIDERCAYHRMIAERGSAGEVERGNR